VKKSTFLVALLLATAIAGCGRPLFLLPGGALEGPTAAAATDWSFTDAIETVQLESNPADPYSVNIWVIARASGPSSTLLASTGAPCPRGS